MLMLIRLAVGSMAFIAVFAIVDYVFAVPTDDKNYQADAYISDLIMICSLSPIVYFTFKPLVSQMPLKRA